MLLFQEQIFFIIKKQKKDEIKIFWLKNIKIEKFLEKIFQREKIYYLSGNFI